MNHSATTPDPWPFKPADPLPGPWWVFTNKRGHRRVFVERNPTWQQLRWLAGHGHVLVWDSAPTADAGFDYAVQHHGGRMLDSVPDPSWFARSRG